MRQTKYAVQLTEEERAQLQTLLGRGTAPHSAVDARPHSAQGRPGGGDRDGPMPRLPGP
jgi:hypothetical protein